MSDTRSQLEEVDALIAAAPDDPALQQLREDLLQLIALEEQESAGQEAPLPPPPPPPPEAAVGAGASVEEDPAHPGVVSTEENHDALQSEPGTASAYEQSEQTSSNNSYTAQGTFMEHTYSKEAVAEAPDLGAFQPVASSNYGAKAKSEPPLKSDDATGTNPKEDSSTNNVADTTTTSTTQPPTEKKKKKKKKKDDGNAAVIGAKFELPSHLVPLESDTPAQKLKKQRTAKALKSKFRAKQKEAEHSKRQNDWKSFAAGAKGGAGKRKKGLGGGSIFSTEGGGR